MEKILTISGRQVPFKTSGAFLLRYKSQFGRDALADIAKLYGNDDMESLDFEVFYNMVWVLAKTADPLIPPPWEWLDSFETFPVAEVLPELLEMITSNFKTIVPSKKK